MGRTFLISSRSDLCPGSNHVFNLTLLRNPKNHIPRKNAAHTNLQLHNATGLRAAPPLGFANAESERLGHLSLSEPHDRVVQRQDEQREHRGRHTSDLPRRCPAPGRGSSSQLEPGQ